ncbi:MAG: hypothetical protein ACR2IK_16110 [Chloroflexota bacterium]
MSTVAASPVPTSLVSEPAVHTRLAGSLLIMSIVALFAWRLVIVEVILGPVNPADDLPGIQRALLAGGLLFGSLLAAIGFTLLARQLGPTIAGGWARIGQFTCLAAPVVLALGMLGIIFSPGFQILFIAFAALTTGTWCIFGLALWRAEVVRWLGLLTAILGAAMLILILAGTFIIFVMSGALLPLGLGLLLRQQTQATTLEQKAGSAVALGRALGQ